MRRQMVVLLVRRRRLLVSVRSQVMQFGDAIVRTLWHLFLLPSLDAAPLLT